MSIYDSVGILIVRRLAVFDKLSQFLTCHLVLFDLVKRPTRLLSLALRVRIGWVSIKELLSVKCKHHHFFRG
jgi:hypothetical protein